MMSNRENFYRIIAGKPVDKMPFEFSFCPKLHREFVEKHGDVDYHSYYQMPFAYIGIEKSHQPVDYSPYFAEGEIDFYDEWGVGHKRGSVEHFTRYISPMRHFETVEEVYSFPMEDYLADYRWEGLKEKVEHLKAEDKIVVAANPCIDIFEPSWYLRGFENLMCDFIERPDLAEAVLDRTYEMKKEAAARYAAAGFDVIIYGDDVGTEISMMMAPEIWRKWLKPRLAGAIKAAKDVNPNVLCYYHSDGNIELIIDDLIECGIDILNPVQPECMNPVEIYHKYHDRITLWGTIGTQTTMPFGTPEEVKEKVNEMLALCKETGRLVLAPTHMLEPEVPWENIEAFVEAVQAFHANAQ